MDNNKLKIIVETKTLTHALTFANSVVEKRNVVAELSHIKLSSKDGKLELIATNMEIYLSQKVAAQVINEGEITVSTKTLNDIVKKIPDNDIMLNVSDETDQLEILAKNCTFNLLTLPADKFPTLDDINIEATLKIPCSDFVKMIDGTLFSVSLDETRYNLNGVYFYVKEEECYMASTDGHRLSVSVVEIADKVSEFGVILSKKTLEEIAKILKDPKNVQLEVEIFLSVNRIKFVCNDIMMVSKLIDGTFPDYQGFIPVENNYKLTINTKVLADVIDRVSTITVDKFQAIKLTLSKNLLEITASGEARGVGKETIPYSLDENNLCVFDHEDILSIGFNPRYLTDALNAVLNSTKANQVELYFLDASSPMLLKTPQNPKDIFVIMPVKV
ncbi:DNA polymerase III subunit beta [Candidatus Tisiphia endosymbiont of Oplodontha viridula]|uniref:DNA polymerase III subunit beta n=1 Tax=Candidatus Tisiphia endosymbiont of Oplodontha viridula TaxID=3077925 RepID=UPI0035C8A591